LSITCFFCKTQLYKRRLQLFSPSSTNSEHQFFVFPCHSALKFPSCLYITEADTTNIRKRTLKPSSVVHGWQLTLAGIADSLANSIYLLHSTKRPLTLGTGADLELNSPGVHFPVSVLASYTCGSKRCSICCQWIALSEMIIIPDPFNGCP
jgi:hypothetical protein